MALLTILLGLLVIPVVVVAAIYFKYRRPIPSNPKAYELFANKIMAHRGGAAGALRSKTKALPPSTTPYVVNDIEATVAIPENSTAAFIYSADNGADGWELDTYLTKEGIPVVIHDEIIDRVLQGRGTVGQMMLTELQAIPYKDCSVEFQSERIPTLESVLILAQQRGMRVMVEIKEKKRKLQMCRMVYELICKHNMQQLAYAGCFNPYTLWLFRGLDRAGAIETCYIYCNDVSKMRNNRYVIQNHVNAGLQLPAILWTPLGRRALDWAFRMVATPLGLSFIGARIVAMKQDLMTPELAAYNKRHGIISGAWVVNARRDKARIVPLGVNIITDRLFYANPVPKRPLVTAVPSVNQ